jgi:dihydropyrimidinase
MLKISTRKWIGSQFCTYLIRNGQITTSGHSRKADLLIQGGKVAAIGDCQGT